MTSLPKYYKLLKGLLFLLGASIGSLSLLHLRLYTATPLHFREQVKNEGLQMFVLENTPTSSRNVRPHGTSANVTKLPPKVNIPSPVITSNAKLPLKVKTPSPVTTSNVTLPLKVKTPSPVTTINAKLPLKVKTPSPVTTSNAKLPLKVKTPSPVAMSDAESIAKTIPRVHPLSFYGEDLCVLYNREPSYYRDKTLYKHPNTVHYIKLSKSEKHADLVLLDYVSILSVTKNYKPDKIVIHCNRSPTGKYWKMAQSLGTKIELRHTERPLSVGKLRKRPIAIPHEADILKSSIAYEEGGLIIDFDIVILDGEVLRKQQLVSECVLGLERECTFVNAGFLSCVPHTKYTKLWRDSYETDYHNTWGGYLYNCGELPARTLRKCPSCFNMYIDPEVDMNPDAGFPGGPGPGRDPWKMKDGVKWKDKSVAHLLLSHLNLPKDDAILSLPDCSYKDVVHFILGDQSVG